MRTAIGNLRIRNPAIRSPADHYTWVCDKLVTASCDAHPEPNSTCIAACADTDTDAEADTSADADTDT
eukprot:3061596-Alexandrium_andersonii.AAC.1